MIAQIAADALGLPLAAFRLVGADTALTPDAGKTSASRQTVVSGRAAEAAARALRAAILRHANAGPDARLALAPGAARGRRRPPRSTLAALPLDAQGYVFTGEATWDPPTTPLDADGQGIPYAVYGTGAQIAELEVDTALGTVRLTRDHRRPRRRPRDQPDARRGPDRGRRRHGHRPGADGGIPARTAPPTCTTT